MRIFGITISKEYILNVNYCEFYIFEVVIISKISN